MLITVSEFACVSAGYHPALILKFNLMNNMIFSFQKITPASIAGVLGGWFTC
jgi:hypothetical protein